MRSKAYPPVQRKKRWGVKVLLTMLALFLVFVILVAATSLIKADRLMKGEVQAIPPYATNDLPSFRSVSISSGKGQLTLRGWLIDGDKGANRGTIIMVHNQGGNRLPFGLDTRPLLKHFSKLGFNILTFDLRHSGESTGNMSSFGYAEAEDLQAAIHWVMANVPKSPLILFGFGSGSTTLMKTLGKLEDDSKKTDMDEEDQALSSQALDRIAAIIVDSPARDIDAFIQAQIRQENRPLLFWLPATTPYAIRLSVGKSEKEDFFAAFSSLSQPIMILGHEEDSFLKESDYRPMIQERLRLQPQRTMTRLIPGRGHLTSYLEDREAYLDGLTEFLDRWFPVTN
ncbi:MAG: alpha/beta hydrolase [Clostridiaceae bacterium]|nr:alpha/beta hydrolase [Clostridiaceae bacterium]